MARVTTIAHHTMREAVRMKVVLAFGGLILAIIVGLPIAVYRDDALVSSTVQTFLAWSLTPLGMILSFLAIFLSCLSISDEMTNRQIFLMLSKPVPRWKYVVGKWLGVVWVLTGLMVFAGVGIYGMGRVLALQPNSDDLDPYTLEHEVMTARANSKLYVPDLTAEVERLFQRMVEDGRYGDTTKMKAEQVKRELHAELGGRYRIVPPERRQIYEFRDIVLPEHWKSRYNLVINGIPPGFDRAPLIALISELRGIDEDEAADALREAPLTIRRDMDVDDARDLGERITRAGGVAALQSTYLLQLRYKAKAMGYAPDESILSAWQFGPSPELAIQTPPIQRKDIMDRYHIIGFPASAVSENGRVYVAVSNLESTRSNHHGATISFETGSMEVLYVIGSFGGNLMRTMFLIWCRVVLIAAVGVFAATLLSFPVASLVTFWFYVLAIGGEYVKSALGFGTPGQGALGPAQFVIEPILTMLFGLIPTFSQYDGVEVFVAGRNVSLMWDLRALGYLVAALCTAFLLAACVCFRRRQVAELSI